jgi:integrase
MRNRDHHLQLRGKKYSIRYDIPADLVDCFPGESRTVREALGTSDKIEARKRRDIRLRELDHKWHRLRQTKKRSSSTDVGDVTTLESWARRVSNSDDPSDMEALDSSLSDEFGRRIEDTLRQRGIPGSDFDAYERIAKEMQDSPEGERLARAMLVAKGKITPISEIADEWLAINAKSKISSSSLYTYRKALAVLQDRFQTIEEVTHRDAKNFLFGLLQGFTKRTVGQYLIAYRGVWRHLGGVSIDMWNTAGMESAKPSNPYLPWEDDDYIALLKKAEAKGYRDMYLAIRIAAHSGAAAQGLARLDVRDGPEGRSIYLHETKKNHRSRLIPCHPEIYGDVIEWLDIRPADEVSLSKKFGRLKTSLGYGGEHVLHSFRHSVAYKLENARVMDREVQRLLGHKIGKIAFDTYNVQGLGYETLSKVVAEIRWPTVE